jgi:hypothetical protein
MADDAVGGAFSLAFSGAAKKQGRKVEVQHRDEGIKKEEVIGFGAEGLQTAEPAPEAAGPKIIAPQQNTYRCANPPRGAVSDPEKCG